MMKWIAPSGIPPDSVLRRWCVKNGLDPECAHIHSEIQKLPDAEGADKHAEQENASANGMADGQV